MNPDKSDRNRLSLHRLDHRLKNKRRVTGAVLKWLMVFPHPLFRLRSQAHCSMGTPTGPTVPRPWARCRPSTVSQCWLLLSASLRCVVATATESRVCRTIRQSRSPRFVLNTPFRRRMRKAQASTAKLGQTKDGRRTDGRRRTKRTTSPDLRTGFLASRNPHSPSPRLPCHHMAECHRCHSTRSVHSTPTTRTL